VIWVPIYLFGYSTLLTGLHLSILHFFLLFGVLILFDIRDVEYDAYKIKTLPLLIGISWGRWLAIFCFVVGIGYSLVTQCLNYIDLIIPFILILLALKVKPKGPVSYFALLDLLLAVQGLVYYLK
jgi:4-hydroxybenzoate polyprenyltransferase